MKLFYNNQLMNHLAAVPTPADTHAKMNLGQRFYLLHELLAPTVKIFQREETLLIVRSHKTSYSLKTGSPEVVLILIGTLLKASSFSISTVVLAADQPTLRL